MAQRRVERVPPSRRLRETIQELTRRHDGLVLQGAHASEWRNLQYDAVRALISAQREFVELHGHIVAVIRTDRELYTKLRLESIELASQLQGIRDLIRAFERGLLLAERHH